VSLRNAKCGVWCAMCATEDYLAVFWDHELMPYVKHNLTLF
jgi:hypothetical protein